MFISVDMGLDLLNKFNLLFIFFFLWNLRRFLQGGKRNERIGATVNRLLVILASNSGQIGACTDCSHIYMIEKITSMPSFATYFYTLNCLIADGISSLSSLIILRALTIRMSVMSGSTSSSNSMASPQYSPYLFISTRSST